MQQRPHLCLAGTILSLRSHFFHTLPTVYLLQVLFEQTPTQYDLIIRDVLAAGAAKKQHTNVACVELLQHAGVVEEQQPGNMCSHISPVFFPPGSVDFRFFLSLVVTAMFPLLTCC
jgi:hypothetical protein